MRSLRLLSTLLLVCVTFSVTGCGGSGFTVDGQVTKGGTAYTVSEGEGVSINIRAADKSYSATAESNGKFRIPDVAAGSYKVEVTLYPKAGSKNTMPTTKTLSESWDVASGKTTFNIELNSLK
jgi:hypothetical protein